METVLVLRALAMGDLLVAVPALRGLRRRFPGHRIVLAAPAALEPLARRIGAVDDVLPTAHPCDLHWTGPPPDVAVNLHGTGPQSHRALDATGPRTRIGYRSAGWPGPYPGDVARAYAHERERWCAVLAAAGVPAVPGDLSLPRPAPIRDGAPVLVHPGAQYGAKRWPADRFAAVAAALHGAGHEVLVTGSAAERDLAGRVAAAAGLAPSAVRAGRTDVAGMAELVAGAALLVCGDTGPAHLASAYATPSVVLFGPVGPDRWGPPATGPHIALTRAGARLGDPFTDHPDPALLGVGVGEVLAAADRLLPARALDPSSGLRSASGSGPGR